MFFLELGRERWVCSGLLNAQSNLFLGTGHNKDPQAAADVRTRFPLWLRQLWGEKRSEGQW